MRTMILFLCCLLGGITWSCSPSRQEPPLSDEQVALIMAELAIADAATLGMAGYAKDSTTQRMYHQVFEMQGVKKEDYSRSLHQLSDDLPRLTKVVQMADSLLR